MQRYVKAFIDVSVFTRYELYGYVPPLFQALSEAQSMLSSASTDEAKAEAQIAVEVAEELVKAAEA